MIAACPQPACNPHRFARALASPGVVIALTLAMTPATAQTICQSPGNGQWSTWLDQQEAAGGHTKACHLNVGINGLIGRIENRGGHQGTACLPGDAASAWSERKLLLDALKPAIIQNGLAYAAGPAGDHVISGSAGATIGTVVTAYTGSNPRKNRSPCGNNREFVCRNATKWSAIVRKTPGGACYLLTAYPTL